MSLKEETKISKMVRESVYLRDSYEGAVCCISCGVPHNIEIHHIISRGAGGRGNERNLVCLCHGCHTAIHMGDIQVKNAVINRMKDLYEDWEMEDQRV